MCRKWVFVVALALAACTKEVATQTAKNVKDSVKTTVKDALEVNADYSNKPDDRSVREKERFDAQWRQLQYFRDQQAQKAALQQQQQQQQQQPPAAVPANFKFVTGAKENWKVIDPTAINSAPVAIPLTGDVKGPSVLRAQVYLDRIHYSVGSLDGRWGRNSAITTWWFQRARGMTPTGDMDQQTFQQLASEAGYAPVVKQYTVTDDDLKGPFVSIPSSVYDQQNLKCLCYETVREELGEKFHSDPDFLDILNPDVKWHDLQAGTTIVVPNVRDAFTTDQKDIAKVVISIAGNSFNAFDANGRIIFHAPTTLGSGYDPSPSETVHVIKVTPMPHFHYDPTLYHEVPDSDPDAHLPPGPNSPVGVVWMALSKEHYGMHGNPEPESIGYSSSHGCVRLTNWDAEEVSHRISEGVEVSFVDTRAKGLPPVAQKK
ncbi:MAG TPA: L,D-transpeptidase [Thermoanaerobaculia bacterium]|jgi:lipoprotein-anchoring transpeptidase ErfK/SrfK